MFLSEKIKEMVSMGATVSQVNRFKDNYSDQVCKGAAPDKAMEFAEAQFNATTSDKSKTTKKDSK